MKIRINRRSLLRRALLILIAVLVLACAYVELEHRYNYGHFVGYGLHVDALSRDSYIGIPGQKKMYWAELRNFSFWPVSLDGCDYLTDAFGRGTKFPYVVQRWEKNSGVWQTIGQPPNGDNFCHPVPLSTIETNRVSPRLWPGMGVEVMDGEATGATEPFQKDDRARFVVFTKLVNEVDWRDGVASDAFIIEDDVPRNDVPVRVKH